MYPELLERKTIVWFCRLHRKWQMIDLSRRNWQNMERCVKKTRPKNTDFFKIFFWTIFDFCYKKQKKWMKNRIVLEDFFLGPNGTEENIKLLYWGLIESKSPSSSKHTLSLSLSPPPPSSSSTLCSANQTKSKDKNNNNNDNNNNREMKNNNRELVLESLI